MAYLVTKTIKGKPYLYAQRTYREQGKVKTQSKYLGPITTAEKKLIEQGNHKPLFKANLRNTRDHIEALFNDTDGEHPFLNVRTHDAILSLIREPETTPQATTKPAKDNTTKTKKSRGNERHADSVPGSGVTAASGYFTDAFCFDR